MSDIAKLHMFSVYIFIDNFSKKSWIGYKSN